MAPKKPQLGASALTVAENVTRCRKRAGHTMRSLADEMTSHGFPMSHSVVSQMENGARRIDVDDLMALAFVLKTSPTSLLMPNTPGRDDQVTATAVGTTSAQNLWKWMRDAFLTDQSGAPVIPHVAGPDWLMVKDADPSLDLLTGQMKTAFMRAFQELNQQDDNNGSD